MAAVPTKTTPATIGTSATTLYTVPSAKSAIIKEIILMNTHTSALTATINFVPSGGAVATANQVLAMSLDPNQTVVLALSTVLGTGDLISAITGTASKVACRVSVVEF